ncbi:aspartate ammonia-lyase [Pectinatus sottacetonis]|uniref:aspartate ammonia-lyase n=1 Tax=Pectinatus sottacetonis TaxID=1002795 RepID=UPI0018C74029|nr:aspartate ammonia-lyase [Pectinatus sottacetonis]
MREEHDFLGEKEVPENVLYGVQTMRAVDNFHITEQKLDPDFIVAMAKVKKAAALANMDTGRLPQKIGKVLVQAADEVIAGKWVNEFPVDPIQGGAGTSVNMNMNEVLANRGLEIMGEKKGTYDVISPNNHVNMAQSTNDVFPTSIKICIKLKARHLMTALGQMADVLDRKAVEFKDVLKMGRTHLQDAVPITLGQEMAAYAAAVRRGIKRIESSARNASVVNLGATAVGTGLNAQPQYISHVIKHLNKITGEEYFTADNLVDATNNVDILVDVSSAMKVTALVLIKIANDFRLMASGPRCGFNELKLPARQPGSSIMPGKVNPVIAEVLNQTCYQVIGNDLTVSLAAENGQFELNVMEPVMAFNILNSMRYLTNAVNAFYEKLLLHVTANKKQCEEWLEKSVGIVTALLPHIGYENSSLLAKEAYTTNRSVKDIILEKGWLTEERMKQILSPEQMTHPGITG